MTGPARVFVTVGTDHHPFDRLVSWIDMWLGTAQMPVTCLVQYGTSLPPERADGVDYLEHDRLGREIADADVVVAHGGPGTIMDCRRAGHVPIVVPRRHDLGEHVDNHQLHFSERIASLGEIDLAGSEAELYRALTDQITDPRSAVVDTSHIDEAVDEFVRVVDAVVAARPRRLRLRPIRRSDLR